jgi:hypothetical protein
VHSATRSVVRDPTVKKFTSRQHLNVRERAPRERETQDSHAYNPSMRIYLVTSVQTPSRRASIKEKTAEMDTHFVERRAMKSVSRISRSVRVQPVLHFVINHGTGILGPVTQRFLTNAPRVKRRMPDSVTNPVNRDTGDRGRHVENQRRVNEKIRIWRNLFLSTM